MLKVLCGVMHESVIHLYTTRDPIGSYAGVWLDTPEKSDPLHGVLRGAPLENYLEIHPFFTASEGQGQGIGCAVEVRDRPELFRVVVQIDKGFETTGLEPWTYLLSPGRVDFCVFFNGGFIFVSDYVRM